MFKNSSHHGPTQLSLETEFEKKVSVSFDTLEKDLDADVKVLVVVEPPCVHPFDDLVRKGASEFDLILTYREWLVEELENAQLFNWSNCWINDAKIDKRNQLSYLTTNKGWCEGHKLRQEIWYALEEYDEINDFEVWKKRSPPSIPNKNVALENAKFTISLENSEINNYFSEKLLDCFETKTIPLYWGCPNVGDYFNMDGILHFHTIEEMEDLINTLIPELYDAKLEAVEDNYLRGKKYHNAIDRVADEVRAFISK